MHFVVFVEGKTEKQGALGLIAEWLRRRLEPNRVGMKAIDLKGFGNLIKEIPRKARIHLEGKGSESVVAAVGLLDLYGCNFFPSHLKTTGDLHDWGKQAIETEVNHDKFRMFFAVHEVEAWLLSRPEILGLKISEELKRRLDRPEAIDLDKPPAKLIAELFRLQGKGRYGKVKNGPQFFAKVDPDEAHRKCPYLSRMLDEMLRLARQTGL